MLAVEDNEFLVRITCGSVAIQDVTLGLVMPAVLDPDNPDVMEKLVAALGATPVRHRNWYLCCGKACQTEDVPSTMMRDLLTTVHEENADVLGMICPTCFGQFDHGQMKVGKQFGMDFGTPPIYYFQMLAFAQGVPYDALGFERQRFKPEALKCFEEVTAAG